MQYAIEYGTPNAETIDAIEYGQRMRADPTLGKIDDNVDDMMRDLLDV